MPVATAFQTIGPFWHLMDDAALADLTRFGATGEFVTLTGRITDGDGEVVHDACVELWQASPDVSEIFPAWGRCASNSAGEFHFTTLKPGPVPGLGNSQQAPHFAITILARGILTRLCTRAYFAGDPRNDADPLLGAIDDPVRRQTLIAEPVGGKAWRLDIRLQGENETVFLEV